MDNRLYTLCRGRRVARTCKSIDPETGTISRGCGATLAISDYNTVICPRCEEPQRQTVIFRVETQWSNGTRVAQDVAADNKLDAIRKFSARKHLALTPLTEVQLLESIRVIG